MTDEEAFSIVATKAGAFTADELRDFCTLPPDAQERAARTYRSAVFAAQGPSGWAELLAVFGTVAAVATDASGLAGAYSAFRAIV